MTDQQIIALFGPVAPMPADVSERLQRHVFGYLRRQRAWRMARRVIILVILALWLATTTASAAEPLTVSAVVVDATGQRMPGVSVDVIWASADISASARMTTDDAGELVFDATPGDLVTVRVNNCHQASRVVAADNEPLLVAPLCVAWLPVVVVDGRVDAATRFWGG